MSAGWGLLGRLAWGRLRAAPVRSLVLVGALGTALALPLFALQAPGAVDRAGRARVAGLPLVVGPPGGAVDLLLAALTLQSSAPARLPAATAAELAAMGAGGDVDVLALHLGHAAGGAPIVGLGPGHGDFLGLHAVQGRGPVLLGEAVVGARLARERGLAPGDLVRSSLAAVHDVARTQSFGLDVVGVWAETGTALDGAVAVSLPTAWLLDGHLHGHATAAEAEVAPDLAGAGDLLTWRRVSDENRASFHQHGALDQLPVSLVLVRPRDARALDLVLGELALRPELVGVRPETVLARVVGVLFSVREGLLVLGGLVLAAVLGLTAVLGALLGAARAEETRALRLVGLSPGRVRALVALEVGILGVAAAALASALAAGGLAVLVARLVPG